MFFAEVIAGSAAKSREDLESVLARRLGEISA
jgi:hypothetical protein